MTQTTDAALVERLRKRLADASPQPWAYRPKEYDDWGMIRGPERHSDLIGPYQPIVARGHDSEVKEGQKDACRANKTDPYGPNALLITDAVNALPGLLDTIEAQARRIEALEGEAIERGVIDMLTLDHKRMRAAGTALAEAALRVVRECDGLHRLSLAVADWSKAIADEGGRAARAALEPTP